jgi:hypothetical protein
MKSIRIKHATSFFEPVLSFVLFMLLAYKSTGQDKASIDFGKVKIADFSIQSPLIDSGTNAVIVYDKCDISFEGNKRGWFSYILKRSVRKLILHKKGFDLATEIVQLYRDKDSKEVIENLWGTTYNIESGKIVETKLNSKDVFEEKAEENYFISKFTMPAVKEGALIEYSYTIKSEFQNYLPAWKFQHRAAPTLWSELNVVIPSMLTYMTYFQGYHQFHINKGKEGFQNYSVPRPGSSGSFATGAAQFYSVSTPTVVQRWVMKDVPAFANEIYMSSPVNYIDQISFQLYKWYDGQDSHNVLDTWKTAADKLLLSPGFGTYLFDYNDWMDKIINQFLHEKDDALSTAKKIYYYIQNNYTCTNPNYKYITTSLQDVVKRKSGSVGDLNLLLIAMLNRKNLNALPVVLSTREYGRNPVFYPMLNRLNYVIGKVTINAKDYYLDAATPFLPFGNLPAKCYNGHARVISKDTLPVFFEPGSLKERSSVNVIIYNEKDQLEGSCTNNMGFIESLQTRDRIATSGLTAYHNKVKESFGEGVEITAVNVNSLEPVENDVSVRTDFKIKTEPDGAHIYFSPVLTGALKKNPFYAAERVYPVEMPWLTDEIYSLSMEIPKGYKVEELPKPERIMLNENDGMFEYLVSADAEKIQMRIRLQIQKAVFTSEDYQTLRDFYAFIVKKQAEQIVFKKNN